MRYKGGALAVMGSPDPRQIDGIGGADPLTSKVQAIIRRSARPDADGLSVLFARPVNVAAAATVDYGQNCGNILAAVGPFRHRAWADSPMRSLGCVFIYGEHGQRWRWQRSCDADGVDYVGESYRWRAGSQHQRSAPFS